MGWSIGFDSKWNRDIGYAVPAYCDYPGCEEEIDRGLSYVCSDQQPYGGDEGCGLYFCSKHVLGGHRCRRCVNDADPFPRKPDHPTWMRFKLRDPSWSQWRKENPQEVAEMRTLLRRAPKPTQAEAIAVKRDGWG